METETNRFDVDASKTKLEQFKAEIFFPDLTPPEDINSLLQNLGSAAFLKALSPLEAAEFATVLAQYSLYLTIQENRISSYVNWCESNIKYIVGRNLQNTSGYGFPEKDLHIRSNEPNAMALEKDKLMASVKLDSIRFVSQRIQYYSDKLDSLAGQKRKEMYQRG